MNPIAAYYIFTASEQQRTAAHGIPLRQPPSPLERVRSLAAAVRPQGSRGRSARTA